MWAYDGQAYKPSPLARRVIQEAVGVDLGGVEGTAYWVNPEGQDLITIAKHIHGTD